MSGRGQERGSLQLPLIFLIVDRDTRAPRVTIITTHCLADPEYALQVGVRRVVAELRYGAGIQTSWPLCGHWLCWLWTLVCSGIMHILR